jgi:hypothetical protein
LSSTPIDRPVISAASRRVSIGLSAVFGINHSLLGAL